MHNAHNSVVDSGSADIISIALVIAAKVDHARTVSGAVCLIAASEVDTTLLVLVLIVRALLAILDLLLDLVHLVLLLDFVAIDVVRVGNLDLVIECKPTARWPVAAERRSPATTSRTNLADNVPH
jgi:hypothetical protein